MLGGKEDFDDLSAVRNHQLDLATLNFGDGFAV